MLRDKDKVGKLVKEIDPLVRAIDGIVGERVSMRVSISFISISELYSSHCNVIQVVSTVRAYYSYSSCVYSKSILIPLKLCSEQYAKGETTDDYCWIKLILFVQVDLECSNGRNTIGLFSHRKLSV